MGGVMIWGSFSEHFRQGELFFLPRNTTMNGERYINVMKEHLLLTYAIYQCECRIVLPAASQGCAGYPISIRFHRISDLYPVSSDIRSLSGFIGYPMLFSLSGIRPDIRNSVRIFLLKILLLLFLDIILVVVSKYCFHCTWRICR